MNKRSPISRLWDAGIGFDGSPLPGREKIELPPPKKASRVPAWMLWLRCVLVRGGHNYGRWQWPDRDEACCFCEECADMQTPKNRHAWLHRGRISKGMSFGRGFKSQIGTTVEGRKFSSDELHLIMGSRMARQTESHAMSEIARQIHEKPPLSERGTHYFADGSWHPVILDPMGDQTSELCKQWYKEQQQEKQALIAVGEPIIVEKLYVYSADDLEVIAVIYGPDKLACVKEAQKHLARCFRFTFTPKNLIENERTNYLSI